jgi:hypothetical protein
VHHKSNPDRAASQAKVSKVALRPEDMRVLITGRWSRDDQAAIKRLEKHQTDRGNPSTL